MSSAAGFTPVRSPRGSGSTWDHSIEWDLCWLKRRVQVREIQCFKIPVRRVQVGQSCSMQIQLEEEGNAFEVYRQIKKGILMISSKGEPVLSRNFIAKILLCNKNSTSVKTHYEPMLISDTFKQHCRMIPYNIY